MAMFSRSLFAALIMMLPAIIIAEVILPPKTYKVTGIAAGDVLNIRAAPLATAVDLGDLKESAGPIEVLETDETGKWGRILWQGDNAWISLKYLAPIDAPTLPNVNIPVGLQCVGTEPFWLFQVLSSDEVKLDFLTEQESITAKLAIARSSANLADYPVLLLADANELNLSVLLRADHCDDGMSDQLYGWVVDIIVQRLSNASLFSGCCFLPIN